MPWGIGNARLGVGNASSTFITPGSNLNAQASIYSYVWGVLNAQLGVHNVGNSGHPGVPCPRVGDLYKPPTPNSLSLYPILFSQPPVHHRDDAAIVLSRCCFSRRRICTKFFHLFSSQNRSSIAVAPPSRSMAHCFS
ncbi:hypothetical protein PIB30_053909 [Stylosanthes scabra]|uniref:Uncharacterized protein n=1 Tax=Stylosanthes scabra TaxID=79078 RepID=A0ABU6YJ45_9FABA|nr:hypothetical protein [Stylosanthes scabra]